MDIVAAGDLESLEKVKVSLSHLIDPKTKHNAVFFAMLVPDERKCMKILEYLLNQGLDFGLEDELK